LKRWGHSADESSIGKAVKKEILKRIEEKVKKGTARIHPEIFTDNNFLEKPKPTKIIEERPISDNHLL